MALDDLNEDRVDLSYLVVALRQRGLRDVISGSAQPQITRQPLLNVQVVLPPLDEQQRIAAILNHADGLRRKRRLTLERLNDLTWAVFDETFGKLVTKAPRIPLAEGVEEFRYGTSNKSDRHGYPTLRIPNVLGGSINLDGLKYVPVDAREFERLRLRAGDILFVRTNGNPDYVGRSAVVTTCLGGIAADQYIYASYLIRARLRPKLFHPVFLQAFLSTVEGRRQIREFAKTSAGQFNINVDGLSALMIPKVGFGSQMTFSARIAEIDNCKSVYRAHLAKLDELFISLQHRTFQRELTFGRSVEPLTELEIAG